MKSVFAWLTIIAGCCYSAPVFSASQETRHGDSRAENRVTRQGDSRAEIVTMKVREFDSMTEQGQFAGVGGVPIAWRAYFPEKKQPGLPALIIMNGRSEAMKKYIDVIHDLKDLGFAIYLYDHRGQGESGRMLPDSQKGYVENYQNYIDDLGTFIRDVVEKNHPSQIHILAHSLGAAVASAYVIQHPQAFASMVFTSPMYRPKLGSYPEFVALAICETMRLIGKGTDLAPGRTLDEWKNPFSLNNVTQSKERYEEYVDLLLHEPRLALGGPTYTWIAEAIRLSRYIRANAEALATVPILDFEASRDVVVFNSAIDEVCSKSAKCQIVRIEDAKHELLMEADPYRSTTIQKIKQWLLAHRLSSR